MADSREASPEVACEEEPPQRSMVEQINRLSEARTVFALIERLKPILSELALAALAGSYAETTIREDLCAQIRSYSPSEPDTRPPDSENRGRASLALLEIMMGTHPSLEESP